MKTVIIPLLLLTFNSVDAQISSTATVNEYNLQTLVAELKQ